MNFRRCVWAIAVAGLLVASTAAAPRGAVYPGGGPPPDADRDGISDYVEDKVGTPTNIKQTLVLVATSPERKDGTKTGPDILRFEACHVAHNRLLFRTTFSRKPDFTTDTFTIHLDQDNNLKTGKKGTDVLLQVERNRLRPKFLNRKLKGSSKFAAALAGPVLYIALDAKLDPKGGAIPVAVSLESGRPAGKGDAIPRKAILLPFHKGPQPPRLGRRARTADLRCLSEYRYYNNRVKLQKLSDKGIPGERIAKPFKFGRPRPNVPFAAKSRKPGKAGTILRQRIAVHLLEEAGVARSRTPITFGFPLPPGGVYDLKNLRVLSPEGREVPAQFTATVFWPMSRERAQREGSLKWVLVDFAAALGPKAEAAYAVEFGSEVRRATSSSKLRADESDRTITVVTGPLKVVIDKTRFNVFRAVSFDKDRDGRFAESERVAASAADGIRLVDEQGKRFAMSGRKPDSVRIEERGPRKVVVRVAGKYASADGQACMDYVLRLTFRERSPCVTVAHSHIDAYLKTEFTDITSLTMPMAPGGGVTRVTALLPKPDGALDSRATSVRAKGDFKMFQMDDRKFSLHTSSAKTEGEKYPGVALFEGPAGRVGVIVHELWQRWPKAFEAGPKAFTVGILPEQPNADFGKGLPHYLFYPFVSGKYRFKWGMSFTTHITFDFSGGIPPAELAADANLPIVAVLPASWYAATKGLGRLAAPFGKQFAEWDRKAAISYATHMARKRRMREYGYFNYGDWYGERGRNWGNNEYDMALCYFMQFARTGVRDYFRLALTTARHQADADIVHAYPNGFFVGANHQHSIGHTGYHSQNARRATWSYKYGGGTWARNGHTWSKGMMAAWYLRGEPRVMEACIGLGEHIAWAMSRRFKRLSTHERTAGWSLLAIMGIYRGTYDAVYLEAAKRILAVALKEQKFDQGGAWPHRLPGSHAQGYAGAKGNVLGLIGILLCGMMEYHEFLPDPAVEKSMIAAANWAAKSWSEELKSWPGSAKADGTPLYARQPRAYPYTNAKVVGPLAYIGMLTGDKRLMRMAHEGFHVVARGSAPSGGKSIASSMVFVHDTIALLQEMYAKQRSDKGLRVLDGSPETMRKFLSGAPDARDQRVRGPKVKVWRVKVAGDSAALVATRHGPHRSMTIEVRDASGKAVKRDRFRGVGKIERRIPLKAGTYRVAISEGQGGIWNLTGEGMKILMETVPGFRIGGVKRRRLYFHVPRGTREFTVRLVGTHSGGYGGAVFNPAGQMACLHQGANTGPVLLPWAPGYAEYKPKTHPERGVLRVKPSPAHTGTTWSIVLWAVGDIGCELQGVPPYLAISKDALFLPK